MPFQEWIHNNLHNSWQWKEEDWRERFTTCLWCIWKWWNDEVFNNRIIDFNRKRAVVNSYNHEFIATFASQAITVGGRHMTRLAWVGWSKRPLGW